MFRHNFLTYATKLIVQVFLDIIFFPVWWYTIGFGDFAKRRFLSLSNREKSLGFSVWLKNIFVPMYGQTDFSGRMISFFIRLVQIIVRGIVVLIYLIITLIIILLWLALPILLILALMFQLI